MPIEYSQVRKGQVIIGDDSQLYTVIERDLNTPGNWRSILQLKLKNLKTGSVIANYAKDAQRWPGEPSINQRDAQSTSGRLRQAGRR